MKVSNGAEGEGVKDSMAEKPKQIEHPDLTELRQACVEYVDAVSEVDPGSDDDVDLSEAEGAIAESALNAFYGEGVWDFINERVT